MNKIINFKFALTHVVILKIPLRTSITSFPTPVLLEIRQIMQINRLNLQITCYIIPDTIIWLN